jgi:hypothetical protein
MLSFPILRSPESVEEGAAAGDEIVTISRSELTALQARIEMNRSSDASPKAGLDELEARFAKELAERERQATEWEGAFKSAVRDRELATALAGRQLVSGAAAQLIKLWHDEFSVHEERGEFRVRSQDGRPIAEAVTEMLARAEFAHFCQPSSRGGTAQRGTNVSPAVPAVVVAPRNLGEAVIQQWREAANRPTDGSSPIGLRRRR